MFLAGIPVADRLVLDLARLVDDIDLELVPNLVPDWLDLT
jgi:hypothetical protein